MTILDFGIKLNEFERERWVYEDSEHDVIVCS